MSSSDGDDGEVSSHERLLVHPASVVDMGQKPHEMRRMFGFAERHVMVALCSLCCLLNYADRVNMSVAIIAIGEEYGYSVTEQGAIMSAFFWGYIPSQLIAAILCRRHGAKRVLAFGAAGWSLFTALTPVAASAGMPALLACRVGMGLTEGVAFPSMYHFFGAWVPLRERGRALSALSVGTGAGTTIALVLSPEIIRIASWHAIFYSFGAAGFVWLVIWFAIARDTPYRAESSQKAPITGWLSDSERHALKYIVQSRACLAQIATQFLSGLFHYTVLSWLPTYFTKVFHVNVKEVWFTFIPYLAMTISAFSGGWLSDLLAARTGSLSVARKTTTAVANGGAGVLILAFASTTDFHAALLAISLSLAFFALNAGGFDAAYLDMSEPSYGGLLKAVANTFGAASGAIAVAIAAQLLEWSGSWRFVFCMQALWGFLASVVFARFGSTACVLTDARFTASPSDKL